MDVKTSAERKARVISSAEVVFLQQGYARTTMGDLAEAVGMSRPALYLVYPRKHEVFSAIIDEEGQFGAGRGTSSETDLLQHWMVWVCDLWLGESQRPPYGDSHGNSMSNQRAESFPKDASFLETVLDEGLAKRLPSHVSRDVGASAARALTFCVCGLIGGDLSGEARRDLLAFQVEALAQAMLRCGMGSKHPVIPMTQQPKLAPATGRASAWR